MSGLREDSESHGRDTSPLALRPAISLRTQNNPRNRAAAPGGSRGSLIQGGGRPSHLLSENAETRSTRIASGRRQGQWKNVAVLTMAAWWHGAKRDR